MFSDKYVFDDGWFYPNNNLLTRHKCIFQYKLLASYVGFANWLNG